MKYWHKRVELKHEVLVDDDGKENVDLVLVAEDGNTYLLEDFIPSVTGSRYDAVMGVTNTSAVGLVWGADLESGVIQAFG
jgi:hypothetical protein